MSDTSQLRELLDFRKEKDRFFKTDPYSPLSPEQQQKFNGLRYFDPNPALMLELKAEPYAEKKHVQMQTSTGEIRSYVRWGKVAFQVDDQTAELTLYSTPGQPTFFLPFTDSTTGTESYDAGRYLDVERLAGDHVLIDFNVAYNPYCAYSPHWSCPIPPAENRLKVPIRAGEMKPQGEWVETVHE